MSGSMVLISGTALGGIVAVPVLAGAAYLLAQAWVEQRREEAESQRQAEMARIAAWQIHCQRRDQELATGVERIQTVQAHLAALQQVAVASLESRTATPAAVLSRGFLEADEADASSLRLAELGGWLDRLPETLAHAPGFPGEALRRQYQRLAAQTTAGQPPDAATLEAVREGMERTLAHFVAGLERQQTLQRERLAQAEQLLNRILILEQLADASLRAETGALRGDLLAALARGALSAKDFDTLERQTRALEQRSEERLAQAAARHAMMISVSRHLADLGYRSLVQSDDQAEWAVPGGERLRLSIGEDFRLDFRLVHERPLGVTGVLGLAERDRVRRQEARWCMDARTLLRQLVQDGIDLRVAFEAEVPEAQLPLVVVERPEDWQEDEAEERPAEAIHRKAWPDEH
ncbi:conserved hypothetical protein [Gammaproteobacteria bacterium]